MGKWKIYTPEGVQDILFEDCFMKRNLEAKIRGLFRSYGYYEIETPTVEFYDAFAAESDLIPQETMFKFFDQQGRILVLRPDITIPVARVAATKYKDREYPLKSFYIGNTFKYNELGGGKQKEFTQAGVEVMCVSAPEADAEVIATAINAVKATGIESFQIDIGQVEFFKGLMEETGLSAQDIEQMRVLIDSKDYLGIEELVKSHNIADNLKELILSLPRLFGSIDVIEKVKKMTSNERSLAALENLKQILEILEDYGLSKYVSIDLGMVQSLNYYTGIIFRGFTYGIGFPILSGGRYDKLVEKFGKNCPATGFSLGINMIMMALDRQKIAVEKQGVDSLICYKREGRKTAFEVCQELREQGLVVEMDITMGSLEDVKKYAASKGIGGIIYIVDSENIEVHNLENGEMTATSIGELLNKR
ncbi:MAG: ATP phosphoribosyltransferase regulatory subunit [Clostridia bacterium]|nr:ATP phosphoribosyltransferase regulatory subunit [Clostridia bacterium]